MMGDFFTTGSGSLYALNSAYDSWLVSLSVAVAMLASYTALDLSGRVAFSTGRLKNLWLLGGAVAMGIGIWSMHFVGMLAFSLPVEINYDYWIVAFSMVVAMLASGIAMFLVSRSRLTLFQLVGGAILMGMGIAVMHYTGMAAMQMEAMIQYDPLLFFLSILIATAASLAALWIAFQLKGQFSQQGFLLKIGSSVIMGIAIAGMHYTGMAAAQFLVDSASLASLDPTGDGFLAGMAVAIGVATVVILGFVLMTSFVDRRLATQVEMTNEENRRAKEFLERRVLELLMQVQPVSKGDLTVRAVVTEDQVGTIADSYNATIFNLRKLVTQVLEAAQKVGQTTELSDASVKRLAQGAVAESKMIQGALDQLKGIEVSIQDVALNAQNAARIVAQTEIAISSGEASMNHTVEGFTTIRESVSETAKKVKRLGESSQKIARIVQLITGFANQTNLLAFNASIEAARAGEAGRGFAVVADEVRSLAKQSAEATREIETLVSEIQSGTHEAIIAMETGTEQVVEGTRLVEATRLSLEKIANASSEVNELVKKIAAVADRQAQESSLMTKTMADITVVSNRTSAEASKVLQAIKDLQTVAQTLLQSVERFKVE
ncbi:MAG: MHYT domain-containing protein [Cyanobacteriota bacterium]|nr:MHYT domain-containing protein [Cyanobacteriota bacterium]